MSTDLTDPEGTADPAASLAPVRLSPEGYDPESLAKVPIRGRLRRLMASLFMGNIGIFLLWGAIPAVLLPLQIEGIDPANKVANLAVVSTIGAFVAMVAQPVAGMVSDRTRGRLGRRAPWMLAGVAVGGLALIGMASANTLLQVGIAWAVVQMAYNFTQGPLSAVMPDRVPRGVRGTFAAVAGMGLMLGVLGGQILGAQFRNAVPTGYMFLAGFAALTTVAFIVLNRDRNNTDEPREPFDMRVFLRTFWVSPRKHPDFAWGFANRLLLYVGYFLITGYQLYLLQDYVGLEDAASYIPQVGVINLAGIVIATVIAGPLSDRLGRRKPVVMVAGIVMGVSLLVPWLVPTLTGWMVFAALAGLGFGAYQSVDTALMSEVLPSQNDFAKDLGVLNIAATLPQTIAPGLAGLIVVSFDSYAALFPIAIVLALAGAVAVLPIKAVR